MTAFFAALDKYLIQQVLNNTPSMILLMIAVISLAVIVTMRVNKAISKEGEQNSRIEIVEKQLHKTETIVTACPCISKENATWLQDKTRNGGKPPETVRCPFQKGAV
ncbi:MAG: hypothetical protein HQM10_03955 [Candidatus Riflebacteria bacterium]|nr:hypothetical protein [Candidatus Riflebacteria bacterium]